MGRVVYLMNVSLDGYVEDRAGSLAWTRIDEELHRWFNEETRRTDAMLYGRRLYETMVPYWPMAVSDPSSTEVERDFARAFLDTPRIVFSSTLESVDWNSRLVRGDVLDELPHVLAQYPGAVSVGGPTLASSVVAAGLVDEFKLMVHPVVVGGGKPFWPDNTAPVDLELTEERRFASGVVLLAYRRRTGAAGSA
jgi:dihydrofolate reductase